MPVEDLRNKRILIVDDSPDDRQQIAMLLREWSCTWSEAATAHAAMEELRRAVAGDDPFDVVLIDLVMPDIDGETLAGRITQDPDLQAPPLLLMTSCSHPDSSRLRSAGFAAFFTKPAQRRQLLDCLSVALSELGRERRNP